MSATLSQFARDTADAGPQIARENQRIRQIKLAQTRQFEAWDKMRGSEAWADYTASRGLEVRQTLEGLPHAPESEAACLGAMMLSGRACRKALFELRPPCFGRAFNALIFLSVARINQRARQGERIKVDFPTVAAQLRRDGKWRSDAGDYLMWLIESCPSAVNVSAYIHEILECSRLRFQIELAEKIRSVAFAGAHPDQIANAIRRSLDGLETRSYCDLKTIFEECK